MPEQLDAATRQCAKEVLLCAEGVEDDLKNDCNPDAWMQFLRGLIRPALGWPHAPVRLLSDWAWLRQPYQPWYGISPEALVSDVAADGELVGLFQCFERALEQRRRARPECEIAREWADATAALREFIAEREAGATARRGQGAEAQDLRGNVQGKSWQRVQERLLDHAESNPFPGIVRLAKKLNCDRKTIRKAISNSTKLGAWKGCARQPGTKGRPLTDELLATVASGREDQPGNVPPAEEPALYKQVLALAEKQSRETRQGVEDWFKKTPAGPRRRKALQSTLSSLKESHSKSAQYPDR